MSSVELTPGTWKKCSNCKKSILFGQPYWTCNVSTCNRARTAMYFCSVSCWDAHLPIMNHREAWAIENRAPRTAAEAPTLDEGSSEGGECLVVVTKVKAYIRSRWGMNTSGSVMDILSDAIRKECDAAIETARKNSRQTVMDRDISIH